MSSMHSNLILVILLSCVLLQASEQSTVLPNVDDSDTRETTVKPLIVKSVDQDKTLPKETQMAQCTITSGDIKASAQATFSKKLEGFCSTADMVDLRAMLTSIETRLHEEIYDLKAMVRSLLPQNYNQGRNFHQPDHYQQNHHRDNYQRKNYHEQNHHNPHHARNEHDRDRDRNYQQNAQQHQNYHHNNVEQNFYDKPRETTTIRQKVGPINVTATTTEKAEITTRENVLTTRQPEVTNVMKNKFKSLEKRKPETRATIPTTTASPSTIPKNEYTYYWKLENFPKVFLYAMKNEVYSHVFNVKGLFLRIRAAMNDLDNEILVLDIEHLANIDNTEKMEIEISDGLVFQEIAEEKLFQYNFAIMDQTRPDHDLISPIYWNTDTDNFLVPNSVHMLGNYIKNDAILIKLVITF